MKNHFQCEYHTFTSRSGIYSCFGRVNQKTLMKKVFKVLLDRQEASLKAKCDAKKEAEDKGEVETLAQK